MKEVLDGDVHRNERDQVGAECRQRVLEKTTGIRSTFGMSKKSSLIETLNNLLG